VAGKASKPAIEALSSRPVRGVVEYVFSGSRYKVSLPSEGIVIQVNVAQVRCPLGAKGAGAVGGARAAEPFSEEAKQFAKDQLFQKSVR
jgi:staphylococcal nuclease domain-containing protein 1